MKIKPTPRSNQLLAMLQDNARLRKEYPTKSQELFSHFAWPGGYPLFYLTQDNCLVCATCANDKNMNDSHNPFWMSEYITDVDVNYESELYCDACSQQIESAYGIYQE